MGVLLLAAACILLFSFFRIDITPSGQICYKPDNPYWKIMTNLGFFDSNISLCRAYWITVVAVAITVIVLITCAVWLALLGGLLYVAYDAILNSEKESAALLGYIGILAVLILALIYLIKFLGGLEEKMAWFEYVNTALRIIVLLAVLVALPIFVIAAGYKITYSAAILVYLKWIGIAAIGVGGTIFLIWMAFKYLPVLSDTWVGYIFRYAKKELCPQLVACPISVDAANQPAKVN